MNPIEKAVAQAKLRIERARSRFGLVDIVLRVFKRFSEDDGGSYAAALTYYTFLSIFPLMLFSVSIIGFLTSGNQELRNDLIARGVDSVPLLRDILKPAGLAFLEERKNAFALTGLVLTLYSGSGAVVALEHALNKIEHLEDEPNWISKRLRSLKWLGLLGVVALISIVLGGGSTTGGPVRFFLGHAVGLVTGIVGFATAYKFLPGGDRPWRSVLPGAATAAIALEILKEVGTWYIQRGTQSREATFGVFALAAGLLVASFLLAQITLLAAEVNAVLAERRISRQSLTPS